MIEDAVWEALTRALAGEYEIVARLGLGSGGAPVYLARELLTDNLVALRLPPLVSGNEAQEYGLEVVRQIDGSLPEIETRCSHCGATLRQWARFCSRCGRDISGLDPSATGKTRDQLRKLARETGRGRYEVLGEMTRAEGGGLVYFGRDLRSQQIVGLQLEAGPEATVMMTATQFAPPDPSIQIPESRRPSGDQLAKRVSVSKISVETPISATSAQPSATAQRYRNIAIGAVIVLVIVGVMKTCQVV